MIYPSFLKKNDKVFLIAPSKPASQGPVFERAKSFFKKNGFETEYNNIFAREEEVVSGTGKERVEDLKNHLNKDEKGMLLAVSGGEFEMEILPHLKKEYFDKNPKWFVGFSDNTILHHYLLTHLNIASVYHYNIKYFGMKKVHKSAKDSIKLLKGQALKFASYKKYQQGFPVVDEFGDLISFDFNTKTYLTELTEKKETTFEGRMIGGCLDVLRLFLGTKYDKTKQFLEKYKQDGFVWYLEDYNLDACEMKRVLWQMEESGWFKYAKGFVFGRSLFEKACGNITHKSSILSQLKKYNVPIIYGSDIGHVFPTVPVVNGAIGKVSYKQGEMDIEYKLV